MKLNIILIFLSFALTLALISLNNIQEGFDLSVGDISPETFTATHQTENRIATERLRNEARATVVTIFTRDPEIEEQVYQRLLYFFDRVNYLREVYREIIAEQEAALYAEANEELTEEVLIPEEDVIEMQDPWDILTELDLPETRYLSENLGEYVLNLLVTWEISFFNRIQSGVLDAFSVLMENEVWPEAPNLEQEIYGLFAMEGLPYPMPGVGFVILNAYIEPNIIADEEATITLQEERAAEIAPVVFFQNQIIVNEGDVITEEIYQALIDLNYIRDGYTINYIPIAASSIMVLFLFGIVWVYIFLSEPNFNKKLKLLLFTLYIITLISTNLLRAVPYIFVPLLIFTMLTGILINYKPAVVLNICVTIAMFLVFEGGLDFALYFLIMGTIVAIATKYSLERSKVIVFSLAISLLSGLMALASGILVTMNFTSDSLLFMGYGFLAGFFAVIISMGTLPIWESFFGVTTSIKLLDLTNPSNYLLRRLSIEAPGTYYHSIIVANLSETAAYDINADTVLARVGAYFHDIGKLRNPGYFIENQVGENIHDELPPLDSSGIIRDHVEYGLVLAEENKLPPVLQDIIAQHHGRTLLKFFLDKAKKNGEEPNPEDYTYPGPIPQFKEAAIVMLADTVEAAVRSMTGKLTDKGDMATFVNKLIKDKLLEGQLLESGLTIKDLDTIEKSFLRVLNGMYHDRIPYKLDSPPAEQ